MSANPEDLKTVFNAALERRSVKERTAYLDQACVGNEDLRNQVEALLKAHDLAGSFLEAPAASPTLNQPTIDQPITERPGTIIGRYKLLEQIGVGGFGVVFMAEQAESVQRKVALKIIKPGMDTREVIARFEAEQQALAIMDHPNIAKVLDAGATESGRPFFVMELVRGIPITEFCDQGRLSTRERLELFASVCQAVQHAHQKGIIHRDIKPSNVMVTLRDGRPVPKVIDFGVAKAVDQRLTEKTAFTRFGQIVGTLEYMSPEQADLNRLDIDTRSDVYSLGVLLYELLIGETPFDRARLRSAAFDELLRIIREEEPPKPSIRLSTTEELASIAAHRKIEPKKLGKLVRGELDWIVMKALERDRTRRYETAHGFAADIRRYLADESVEACPPSSAYRLKKFARRNKTVLGTLLLVSTALVTGMAASLWQANEAQKARRLASQRFFDEQEAHREAHEQGVIANEQRKRAEAMLLLALQDFNPVGATFGPDGNFYVSSSGTSRILQFHASTGAVISEFVTAGSGGLINPEGLTFGPDANGDGTEDLYVANGRGNSVLQYDGATGAFLRKFVAGRSGGLRHPTGLTFGPDGNLYVMSFASHSVLRYDATDGTFLDEFVPAHGGGLHGPQMGVFGPDGNLYVASFGSDSVLRYDGTSGDFMDNFVPPGSGGLYRPEALAFGPKGTLFVISGDRTGVLRYDGSSGQFLDEFIPLGAGGMISGQTLIFGPDGNLCVVSLGTDSVPRFDGETGKFIDMFVTYDRRRLAAVINGNPGASHGLIRSYLQVAVAQQRIGNDRAAERTLSRAIELAAELTDESAEGVFLIGEYYCHQRQYAKALPYLDRAIRLDPAFSRAYYQRGLTYLALREYDTALADFSKSGYVSSYICKRRAAAHFYLGHFDEALADIRKAVEWSPEDTSNLTWIPQHLVAACPNERFRRGLLGLADRTIELTEHSASAYTARGTLHIAFSQYDDATDDFEKAIEAGPPSAYNWHQISLARLRTDDGDSYRAACAQMLEELADSQEPQEAYWSAWTCLLGPDAVDDYEPVVQLAEQAVGAAPGSDTYLTTLGGILYRAGRFEEAAQRLTEASTLKEDSGIGTSSSPAYTWYFLAMAHHKLGYEGEAQEWLAKARDWTDKVWAELAEGTSTVSWNRKLTLELLRKEAETLLEVERGVSVEKLDEETAQPTEEDAAPDE